MPLESFFAGYTAEMVGFAIVGNLVLSGVLVKNHTANGVSK